MRKVIARIKGGLGNQLFCYAAARRLALSNNAELVIDHVTGFSRDGEYDRRYALDSFHIPARKATGRERMEPLERIRRLVMKRMSRRQPFEKRRYLEQEGIDFDERLLAVRVIDTVYLDGLWQSEHYFKDMAETVRNDLRIVAPTDPLNESIAEQICNCNAVALHVRWFDPPGTLSKYNVGAQYYRRAVEVMERALDSPNYFVFSDDPHVASARLALPKGRTTFVSHNQGEVNGYADLWLMRLCRHFVTANSTFSWWGAWLGEHKNKIVVTPSIKIDGKAAWGFKGLIPSAWLKV